MYIVDLYILNFKLQCQKVIHFLSQKSAFISAPRRRHRLHVSQILMERLLMLMFVFQEWTEGRVNLLGFHFQYYLLKRPNIFEFFLNLFMSLRQV